MRLLLIYITLFIVVSASAQGKYDANWVFGQRCGIDFSDTANIFLFVSNTNSYEASATVSDSLGNLLLYIGVNPSISVLNSLNQVIINGDSLQGFDSATNGFLFLPLMNASYYLFQIQENLNGSCQFAFCNELYYSKIERNFVENFHLTKKIHTLMVIRFMKSWQQLDMLME